MKETKDTWMLEQFHSIAMKVGVDGNMSGTDISGKTEGIDREQLKYKYTASNPTRQLQSFHTINLTHY